MAMQGLYARMNRSPLEVQYWSCVPYLCGEGLAVKYSVRPTSNHQTKIPWNPPADWLRQSMAMRLATDDVELDFLLQAQTDPRRMPIEDASIEWPERLSPFVPVAENHVFRGSVSTLPSSSHLRKELSYNPWHTRANIVPWGTRIALENSSIHSFRSLRQRMNHDPAH